MLCHALRERGHEVLMISFKRQYPQWLFPGKSDKDPSRKPLKVEAAEYWIDSLNPLTWFYTFFRIKMFHPDVIVLQWWTTFWTPVWFIIGVLNRFLLKSVLVYICHNVLPHEAKAWDPWLVRLALRWGTNFTVQSEHELVRLLNLLPKAQIQVVSHPVYDMFAEHKIPQGEARRLLDLPSDAKVLLFFGIVREYKGLKDILIALPEILERLGKVVLLIAGEFWEDKRPYLEMIEELGIAKHVVVEDRYIPNEEVPIYFSAADVLVAPYRRTTGSGVIQMAQGFDVLVVTTRVSGLSEMVCEGKNGLLVPPGDTIGLTQAIQRCFTKHLAEATKTTLCKERKAVDWTTLVDVIEGNRSRNPREYSDFRVSAVRSPSKEDSKQG